jgi:uncharacterized Fe-S radical SAM superfamily protein PflX
MAGDRTQESSIRVECRAEEHADRSPERFFIGRRAITVREVVDRWAALATWELICSEDGRIQCDVCPRLCKLHNGQRGFCFVRACEDDQIVLTTYGRSSGYCIDPIEKKPLNHFLPGTPVLSFGTAGCNLGCKFCQNWDISKSREIDTLSDEASPEAIARAAKGLGCRSVAFTYNDPVIFHGVCHRRSPGLPRVGHPGGRRDRGRDVPRVA